ATCGCEAAGDGVTNPAPINGNTGVSLNADDDGGFYRQKVAQYYAAGAAPLSTSPPAPPPPAQYATFTYPSADAQNVDTAEPFSWTAVPGALAYYLYVGTSQGAKDLVNTGEIPQTSYTVPPLPIGVTLWARIWTKKATAPNWSYAEITFTAAPRYATFIYP